ncbi:hypothetical protein L3X38_036645 [Prunus dulcis]|uniref:Uncharacterized protein n=1 Tax=Prunus dulcis TaxID=3755 RepID=A0AAD4V249_PRUDU|nr:hypothetical protein L3X38_036645 [Prunus dulcis]
MLRKGSRMVHILMICQLGGRSVLPDSPKKDNKKVGAVRDTWDIPLKPPADKLGNRDLLDEVVRSRTSLPFEKQRDVGIPLQSSSCLHKSRNEDRTGRCAHRPNIRNPVVESRAIKR